MKKTRLTRARALVGTLALLLAAGYAIPTVLAQSYYNNGATGTSNGTSTVSISGTPNVAISGTPNVHISSGNVGITGTVPVSGTVAVSGTVPVSGTVAISGTPSVGVTGTVTTAPAVATTTDCSLTALGTTATQVVALSTSRKALVLQNVGTGNIGFSLTSITPVIGAAGTFTLAAGASWTAPNLGLSTAVWAIGSAAGQTLSCALFN